MRPDDVDDNSNKPPPNGPNNCNDAFDVNKCSENLCFTCNGFYGPCYEDPICPVCHSFLLSNHNGALHKVYQTCLPEEKDDDDSGNDEPEEDNDRSDNSGTDPLVPMQGRSTDDQPLRIVNIEQLPPEVMMVAFSYLDDLSMWSAALVNPRWREIIMCRVTTPEYWKTMVTVRWPLFEMGSGSHVKDWFEIYNSLVKSNCCFRCLRQMALKKAPCDVESFWRQRRLRTEVRTLKNDPPDGIKANPLDFNFFDWMATIKGPQGSPYEGGIFFLYIFVPFTYPLDPPVVRFLTKIYHPNISRHGDIGIDSIQNNWSLALTISKVLISIQSLLTDPVCEVCMEPKIGEIYSTDRTRYDDTARVWTWKYAMTSLLPH